MKFDVSLIIFLAVCAVLAILAIWFFVFKVKHLKTPDVCFVDGGVKTGKSLTTVFLAVKQYKKNCFKTRVVNVFIRLYNKWAKFKDKPLKPLRDMPMLYSNMPLNHVIHNDLTEDIVMRKVRIPYKSVVLIDEASLLADSLTGLMSNRESKERFDLVNEKLTLFLKLFGHYTHGGSCYINSQQICDLHFAFRRCCSSYVYVAKNRKYPFFCLLDVREMVHTEDGDSINVYDRDIDKDNRPLFIRKKYYKYYDQYYLSALTDKLPMLVNYDVVKYIKHKDLKAKHVLTFGNYKEIKEFNESENNYA